MKTLLIGKNFTFETNSIEEYDKAVIKLRKQDFFLHSKHKNKDGVIHAHFIDGYQMKKIVG